MKKAILFFTSVITVLSLMAVSVSASCHGNGGGGGRNMTKAQATTTYGLCEITDCHVLGVHSHDNVYYRAHYYGDGHDYHEICPVDGCSIYGLHEHNGEYYYCQNYQNGNCGGGYCYGYPQTNNTSNSTVNQKANLSIKRLVSQHY